MNAAASRTIVVTGASSGIGRALARRAAAAGFAVFAVARRAAELQTLAEEIRAGGGICETLTADVRAAGTAKRTVAEAVARLGRIDVIVNNAGIAAGGMLGTQPDEAIRAQFETHVLAPLALAREALPQLLAHRGHIFFIGSGVARVPTPNLGAYPSAKAAVRAAATQMRREVAPLGIAVTYVDPGAVDTAFMTSAGMPGPPPNLRVSPEEVARKIVHAIARRPATLNVVPWQAAAVALGAALPALTDAILRAAPGIVGTGETQSILTAEVVDAPPAISAPPAVAAPPQAAERAPADAFERALEPIRRRMDRLSLRQSFIEGLLIPGTTLELGDVALRWAGMPNKNERGLMLDVMRALETAGFLKPAGDETWTVARGRRS